MSLFTGIAGLDLSLKLALGDQYRTVCYVEFDSFCQRILEARMRDGWLDAGPIWDDVTTFDGIPWRGRVDLISGGFPCQDISVAGQGAGIIEGKRSGLWREFARLIGEIRPLYVFVENVSALVHRGLDVVLTDLTALGYDTEWTLVRASDVGAPHQRERVFILGYATGERSNHGRNHDQLAFPNREPLAGYRPESSVSSLADPGRGRIRQHDWPEWRTEAAAVVDQQDLADAERERYGTERGLRSQSDCERPSGRSGDESGVVADATISGRRAGVGDDDARQSHVIGSGSGLEYTDDQRCSQCQSARFACESAQCCREYPPLWPPAPNDRDRWARVLADHPDLAPAVESSFLRLVDGFPRRVDRLKAYGNAVVPIQAAVAFRLLWERMT